MIDLLNASSSEVLIILVICTEADGALDKARKHKKRQLEDTLNLVMKKRKVCFSIPEETLL